MSRILFSLLVLYSSVVFANNDLPVEVVTYTPQQINQLFDEQNTYDVKNLVDLVDKANKVDHCMDEYIKKQSKSYSKIVQNNLYDLMNNFNRINSKIQGKKQETDEIPYENKVEALARIQCDAYYTMGVLK